jgi:hypothetical protein
MWFIYRDRHSATEAAVSGLVRQSCKCPRLLLLDTAGDKCCVLAFTNDFNL